MAAILKSAFLDTAILHKTLTQTNSIWLKLIHSDSTWWWQPSWILPCWIQTLPSWIQTPCYILSDSLKNTLHSILTLTQTNSIWLKVIHSEWTWWWQPSWNLPSWIQTPCYLLLDSLKNTLSPLWLWLKLIQTDSNSFILTQLDDGSHIEFCQFAFSYLSFPSQNHSHLPRLVPTLCTKKPSLIDSDSTWWWQPSWTLPWWIQTLPSWILTPCYILSDLLKNTLTPLRLWLKLIQSDSNSFILNQPEDGSEIEFCHLWFIHFVQKKLHSIILSKLDDGSNLEFYQFAFSYLSFPSQNHSHFPRLVPTIYTKKTFTHSFWLNLMIAAILNSAKLDSDTAILDSDTLLSSLRFTQKHTYSTLTMTQTKSIWLKLIHSDSTWWWQQSWILPICIQPY